MASWTIAFLLGVITLQCVAVLPEPEWAGGILLSLILFAAAGSWRARHAFVRRLFLCCVAAALGFAWAYLHATVRLADMLPTELEGVDLQVEGRVVGLPEFDERRVRFLFEPTGLVLNDRAHPFRGRLRLAWYDESPTLAPGERWHLTVKLKRPHGMANPGTFDYEAWLFQQGIRATGYVRTAGRNHRLVQPLWWQAPVDRARAAIREQIMGLVGETPFTGVLLALAIGDRSGVASAQWDVFTATGTNHLMAISGLHIGLVAMLVGLLVRIGWRGRLTLYLPAQKAAAGAALVAAALYALLAGFSVPTQRSLVMIAVVALALMAGRPVRPTAGLALALMGVLLLDPLCVLSPGFWLSFGAVAAIFHAMAGRLGADGVWWRWGRVQVVVAVALTPLLVLFFGNTSVSAPAANLVAVPWVSFLVVPVAIAGALAAVMFPALATVLLQVGNALMAWLWPFLDLLAALAPAPRFASPPGWAVLAGGIGAAWLLAPRGWPARAIGGLWLLPMLLWAPVRPNPGEVWLTLLDVGQGLATVVETAGHTLVYDTGPRFGPNFDTGEAVLDPYLRARGARRIDTLVVSHGDLDHIGGARSLTDAWPVSRLLTGVPAKVDWTANEPCQRGQAWDWDGVHFAVLHPPRATGGNDGSCVLRISAPGGELLLTGDIEAGVEADLVGAGAPLRARVLVVPHHGSKTSSTAAFIDAVAPELALLPVGYRNRFRLPHPTVVARYRTRGITLLDSAQDGAVTVRLAADGSLQTVTWREQGRRYFHWRP